MRGRDGVRRLWALFSGEFEPPLEVTVGDLAAYSAKLADRAENLFLVRSGRVAGALSVYANDLSIGAYVTELAVAASERGRGVARILLSCAERVAYDAGMSRVRLEVREENASARRLYEGVGYGYTGERGRHGLIMELLLDGKGEG